MYHEIAGHSPRFPDVTHACIGLDGETIFDPHPDETGLTDFHSIGFFVVLKPWEMVEAAAAKLEGVSVV